MRLHLIVAAVALLGLGACSRTIEASVDEAVSDKAAAPGEGWTMEIAGTDASVVYLVTGPAGQRAAARVVDGKSALVDEAEAQTILVASQAALAETPAGDERVAIKFPGVDIKVSATEGGVDGERGRVAINAGGVSVNVDGDDSSGDGRGNVRIAGVNEKAALEFIDGLEELSPETKTQMREKLGL
jgi:hypothetical protein